MVLNVEGIFVIFSVWRCKTSRVPRRARIASKHLHGHQRLRIQTIFGGIRGMRQSLNKFAKLINYGINYEKLDWFWWFFQIWSILYQIFLFWRTNFANLIDFVSCGERKECLDMAAVGFLIRRMLKRAIIAVDTFSVLGFSGAPVAKSIN